MWVQDQYGVRPWFQNGPNLTFELSMVGCRDTCEKCDSDDKHLTFWQPQMKKGMQDMIYIWLTQIHPTFATQASILVLLLGASCPGFHKSSLGLDFFKKSSWPCQSHHILPCWWLINEFINQLVPCERNWAFLWNLNEPIYAMHSKCQCISSTNNESAMNKGIFQGPPTMGPPLW